jgi:hypothetical protein
MSSRSIEALNSKIGVMNEDNDKNNEAMRKNIKKINTLKTPLSVLMNRKSSKKSQESIN